MKIMSTKTIEMLNSLFDQQQSVSARHNSQRDEIGKRWHPRWRPMMVLMEVPGEPYDKSFKSSTE